MICYTVLQLYIVAINSSSGAWRGKAEQRLRTGPSTVCAWRVACMVPGPFSSPILLCSALHPRPLARQPFPARLCNARTLSQPPRLHLILAPFFLFFLFELLSFSFFVRFFIFIFIVFVCLEPPLHHPRAKDPSPSMVASFVCSSLFPGSFSLSAVHYNSPE